MEMARIDAAANAIREACGGAEIGLILGSGLADSIDSLTDIRSLSYGDIPGFPASTVVGHPGEWITGDMHGKRVAVMRGRFHYYEGHAIDEVVMPVRVMQRLGIHTVILTNAAGGVNVTYKPGDLMVITDMINFSGVNPLIGANLDAFGPRFPDMSQVFDRGLSLLAHTCAEKQQISLQDGVYMWFSGPSFETPAEIRMARILGADAVGMSTVPEAIAARHSGMRVLGISCITNMAAGILDQPLEHAEVLETGERVREAFGTLIGDIVQAL